MKPAEKIERLIKKRSYKATAKTYDKALGSFLQAVDEHIEQKSAPTEPKIWRKIMKSRITKLAAAAVIIIAGYVVVHLSGGSVDVTTVTFAQITENMKQMPWLHAVVDAKQAAGTEMVDIRLEAWLCIERQLSAVKDSNGKVIFQDELEHIFQAYDPNTETITILRDKGLNWNKNLSSVGDIPGAMIKAYEEAGEKVVRETGKYKGKDVLIFRMSAFLGGEDMWIEMTVDAERQVVVFINQKAFDEDGKMTEEVNAHVDYPETGPESIYDVGVPKSTKIVRDEKEEE
jgi:acetolactate synthase regulatory subunit